MQKTRDLSNIIKIIIFNMKCTIYHKVHFTERKNKEIK